MAKYRVWVSGFWSGYHVVEAGSPEEANEKAHDLKLPENAEMQEADIEIDEVDLLEETDGTEA